MKWFIKCIRNYVNFSGRARRREYWNFVLFSFLLMIVAMILDWICFGQSSFFYGLSGLFLFLPNLAVMARRLHDTGRSAKILIWYYVIGLKRMRQHPLQGFHPAVFARLLSFYNTCL